MTDHLPESQHRSLDRGATVITSKVEISLGGSALSKNDAHSSSTRIRNPDSATVAERSHFPVVVVVETIAKG